MNAPIQGTVYPVLPLRDIVVFPGMIVPLFVGREKSVRALEDVMKDDKQDLPPPRIMSLEQALAYIQDDELVEVTPKAIRLRKRYLDVNDRKRYAKKVAAAG